MQAKIMSFLQMAAEKKTHHFGEHDKQIFGTSYFVTALKTAFFVEHLFSFLAVPILSGL